MKIHSLVYQPAKSEYKAPYRFNRILADELTLIANHGIEGDWKAGRNPKRQLNLMSFEMQETLRAEGFKTNPGELGEQITLSGIDVDQLERGTRLQLGDSAIIEIHASRTPCEWFGLIQGKDHNLVENRVGKMASVIVGGKIRVGDPVLILEVESA